MKGYVISDGYMGYLPSDGKYHEFETEEEYKQYYIENEEAQSSSFYTRDNISSLYEKGGITMKKIVKAAVISFIGAVLTFGTLGLYSYIKEKRS